MKKKPIKDFFNIYLVMAGVIVVGRSIGYNFGYCASKLDKFLNEIGSVASIEKIKCPIF